MANYNDVKLPTPHAFKNKHRDCSALLMGTGDSAKTFIPYKDKIKDRFDVVIGLNFITNDFEDILDYHMIMEKDPVASYTEMHATGKYRRDLPRILNWKTLHKFPQDLNIYKATRANFGGKYDITKYKHNGQEGVLVGPQKGKGLSVGSVMLNALHLACIMGCSDIYMVGADLMFKGKYDHYYNDNNFYRKSKTKKANRSPIVNVKHNGSTHQSTQFFVESAEFMDEVIVNKCRPIGIDAYDFSDGLLKAPLQLMTRNFFERRG